MMRDGCFRTVKATVAAAMVFLTAFATASPAMAGGMAASIDIEQIKEASGKRNRGKANRLCPSRGLHIAVWQQTPVYEPAHNKAELKSPSERSGPADAIQPIGEKGAPDGCGDILTPIGPAPSLETADANADLNLRPYTEEDLYVMAHVIAGEAQCYSDEEQRYVASVVLNRVDSGRYPNTVLGVVFQKGQYSCTRDGNYYREPTAANWANAKYILEHGSVLPGNVVYQSGARQGKGVYLKTNRHYYCY